MTFQSELDVWQTEELRMNASVDRPRARAIIQMAAHGAFGTVSWTLVPLGWRSALTTWTQAWRLMLMRKIDWAALLFTSICDGLAALTWLEDVPGRRPWLELARPRGHEMEVDDHVSA